MSAEPKEGKINERGGRCGILTWEAKSETVDPSRTLKGKIHYRHKKVKRNFQKIIFQGPLFAFYRRVPSFGNEPYRLRVGWR